MARNPNWVNKKRADQVYPRIPKDKLPDMLNEPIHLAWANVGCVWILREIKRHSMIVETPKTHKIIEVPIQDAVYVRNQLPEEPKPKGPTGEAFTVTDTGNTTTPFTVTRNPQ